jgi:glycine betaine/proline transport system ATP-binding protein
MRLQSVLRKTIIFITHDFDEAIRLADRIAIMKDGEIIQSGTPEELVLRPATDYVAEFTRDVQRAKVMSARRLMQPLTNSPEGTTIAADAKISSFAADIVSAKRPFVVVDERGTPIGEVTHQAVINLLAGGEPAEARR